MVPILGVIATFFIVWVGALSLIVVLAFIGAIPLYFLWGYLGPTYFSFLPEVWVNIGYYDIAWMMIFFSFIGNIVFKSTLTATNKS